MCSYLVPHAYGSKVKNEISVLVNWLYSNFKHHQEKSQVFCHRESINWALYMSSDRLCDITDVALLMIM